MKLVIVPAKVSRIAAPIFGTVLFAFAAEAAGNGCAEIGGAVPPDCTAANAGLVVDMPQGENTTPEASAPRKMPKGLVISVDGKTVTGDKALVDRVRRADLALSDADVQLTFDGLRLDPRLDVKTEGAELGPVRAGDQVTLKSQMNYPAFVRRGEFRIIDRAAAGGPETLEVVPVAPNGRATVRIPKGDDIVVVHRVYDDAGRYDETIPLNLDGPEDNTTTEGVEEGTDRTAVRHIPLQGGAVTVYAKNLMPGAEIATLGETVTAAPGGDLVLQRILPIGTHDVDISFG